MGFQGHWSSVLVQSHRTYRSPWDSLFPSVQAADNGLSRELTKRKLFEVGHFSFPDCRTPGPQRRRPGPTACSGFCWHFPMSPGSPPAELQAQSGPRPRGPAALPSGAPNPQRPQPRPCCCGLGLRPGPRSPPALLWEVAVG